MNRWRRTALLIPLLALARGALAQGSPSAAAGGGAEATATSAPSRVRASHRVDVIGPGDKVETVIERLRAARQPPGAGEARASDRPSGGAAGQRREPEQRGGSDDSSQRRDSDPRRPDGERSRPPDGQRSPVTPPSSPDRSGPPPERPHR